MRQAFRPFPLAATASAATSISATTPTYGVLRRALTTTHSAAISTTISPTWAGATAARTTASQSVAFAIKKYISLSSRVAARKATMCNRRKAKSAAKCQAAAQMFCSRRMQHLRRELFLWPISSRGFPSPPEFFPNVCKYP